MCGSSRLFLIPGSQHLLSTNVFCAHMWPFGYLHFSPPVRMASCLLMSMAQLLGHGGNQPLWPCKCFSIAEHFPLLPVPWCTWLLALGSHQPSDFQRTPALGSWLGFLVGHEGRLSWHQAESCPGPGAPLAMGSCKLQARRAQAHLQQESGTQLTPSL